MSDQLIPPKNYFENEVFDEEIENIFRRSWLLGCTADDLPNIGDYLLLQLGKYSVILYNTGNTIAAYQNVCPHRFNRIFVEKSGNSELRCGYHGWRFGNDGALKCSATVSCAAKDQLSLTQYPVAQVGRFVFFNFAATPQTTLKEQLGGFYDYLAGLSGLLGECIHREDIPHRCNWKFLCENTIEISHCRYLHPDSLARLGYCEKPVDEFDRSGHNSRMTINPAPSAQAVKREELLNQLFPRQLCNNQYSHSLYFPNFTSAVFEGLNFSFGIIVPINSRESYYRLWYYTAALEVCGPRELNLLASMKHDTISFGTQIFSEDRAVLEQLQNGVEEFSGDGFVYPTDQRVHWFMESYRQMMDNG